MCGVKVRLAKGDDAKIIEDEITEWLRWECERTETFLKALENRNHLILVAEAEGQIVGVLHLLFYLDILHGGLNCHIILLFVKEGYRGRGIGKKLIDEAVKHADKRRVIEMHVDTTFEDAAKFYRNYGFKDDGVMLELSLTNLQKKRASQKASERQKEFLSDNSDLALT
jgi:ribosomal protein S18 acetylase RimI-like enzyme